MLYNPKVQMYGVNIPIPEARTKWKKKNQSKAIKPSKSNFKSAIRNAQNVSSKGLR